MFIFGRLKAETDVFSAHVILDDETLQKAPEQIRQAIKDALKHHHIGHSTIELESQYQCVGIVCEERHEKARKQE